MDNSVLSEVQRSLGRIEGKQDALLVNLNGLNQKYDDLRKEVGATITKPHD